jgi:hydrogenase maturation protein HypF
LDKLAHISIENQESDPREVLRLRIRVGGIVQGVGFRPFIYRLAGDRSLSGYVLNDGSGVEMEVEGPLASVSDFLTSIVREKPPRARIDTLSAEFLDPAGKPGFVIKESGSAGGRTVLISPEIATCDDCLRELRDPADRRYAYPFINCTNCGPRYTIIRDIPYDRANTTMDVFKMCPRCHAEYVDPGDRRFHAEPVACWECGPRVVLRDASGRELASEDPIGRAAGLLEEGKIVAVKGLGGFHLAVNAADDAAVRKLRERKGREEKPLAVMARDVEGVRAFAEVGPREEKLLLDPARPIVLLRKRPAGILSGSVAPGNRNLGVMLPYTPVHHLLLDGAFPALVMTSGNISEEPIAIDMDDALARLGNIADYYLDHNREILSRCDDSVTRVLDGSTLFVRKSRGYVPLPLEIDSDCPPILACGAHLKNTVALTRGNRVFLSQHIGDLENLAAYDFFQTAIARLEKIVDVVPSVVAHDLHPDYLSTRYALEAPVDTRVGVQHHHAHVASCLGEAGLDGPVIGIALDGTGFGPDATVWGGEILIATRADYERVGHLAPVGMPGGERAVTEPWRMAVSHLHGALGGELDRSELARLLGRSQEDVHTAVGLIESRTNCPTTSSCGRLFDAVSSLCGIRSRVSFEGQAAIELEMAAGRDVAGAYPVEIEDRGGILVIKVEVLFREMLRDLLSGADRAVVSAKFHNWLGASLLEAALMLRSRLGIDVVALSGGCFQNEILLRMMMGLLGENGFRVIINRSVPANDGGISFGQAVVASAVLEGRLKNEVS